MHVIRLIASELFGLFVEDARLAISVLVLVVGLGTLAQLLPGHRAVTVVVLAIGCVAILVDGTLRAARK
jgi:hypothetical protein